MSSNSAIAVTSSPTQIISAQQPVPESTVRSLFQKFSLVNLKSRLRVAVKSKIESGSYNIVKTYGTNQQREESVEIPHDFTDSNLHGFIFTTICLFVFLDRLFIFHVKRKRDFLWIYKITFPHPSPNQIFTSAPRLPLNRLYCTGVNHFIFLKPNDSYCSDALNVVNILTNNGKH